VRISLAAASTYSTTFTLDIVLAFLKPFVIYNAGCHILKAGNIPATSRERKNLMALKEQLLHAFLCIVFSAMPC